MHNGYMPNVVDHKDRNKKNNKIENLREATHCQNSCNRNSAKNSSSKYLGVSLRVQCGKYVSWVAIEAAIAYNKAAIKLHGEFANLNIIDLE